jgi:MmyB-like transcription regulator ligand binding domain
MHSETTGEDGGGFAITPSLEPPVNVLRLALHPDGVAPRIVNFAQLRATLLLWLERQTVSTGDPALAALYQELIEFPGGKPSSYEPAAEELAVPLRIRSGDSVLSFISTITTFARATDVTVAEFSIESLYPTDSATAEALRATSPPRSPSSLDHRGPQAFATDPSRGLVVASARSLPPRGAVAS